MALFGKETDKVNKPEQVIGAPTRPGGPVEMGNNERAPVTRPLAPTASPEGCAYLDKGSKINGKISFDGPARIDGQVDGEINAKDNLTIGETAVVTAQIKAASVTVAGKVSGDISASQRIEIRPAARVLGNLAAPVLVIHEGALFEGHCSMQPESAHDSKITVFPKEERLAQAAVHKQA